MFDFENTWGFDIIPEEVRLVAMKEGEEIVTNPFVSKGLRPSSWSPSFPLKDAYSYQQPIKVRNTSEPSQEYHDSRSSLVEEKARLTMEELGVLVDGEFYLVEITTSTTPSLHLCDCYLRSDGPNNPMKL